MKDVLKEKIGKKELSNCQNWTTVAGKGLSSGPEKQQKSKKGNRVKREKEMWCVFRTIHNWLL